MSRHIARKRSPSVPRGRRSRVRAAPEAVEWEHVCQVAGARADALLAAEDPFYAECAAVVATLMHVLPAARDRGVITAAQHEDMMIHRCLPGFADRDMVAMLLAIGAVAGGRVGRRSSALADRMIKHGVTVPEWARVLREPVWIGECLVVTTADGDLSQLICTLTRASHVQQVQLLVDEHRCGAALEVFFGPESGRLSMLDARRKVDAVMGRASRNEPVTATEFRRLAESALDARAFHDRDQSLTVLHEEAFDEEVGDLAPGYLIRAALVRSRLRGFPPSAVSVAPHRPGRFCPIPVRR